MRLSRDEFSILIGEALEDIPAPFERYLRDVTVEGQDMPDDEACRSVGIRDRRSLLGLYSGVPLTERSVEYDGRLPDRIIIYQRNIERICRSRDEVIEQVRTTVLHEVGHHFGLDEEELRELGY